MPNNVDPLIKLEEGGKAPVLSYNVPEPTSYSGRNFVELKLDEAYFTQKARKKPAEAARLDVKTMDVSTLKTSVLSAMKTGFSDSRLFPNVRVNAGTIKAFEKPNPGFGIISTLPLSKKLSQIDPDEIATMMKSGKRLNIYRSMYGTLTYNYIGEPAAVKPRIMLVETYRLSSFLGAYGAGKTIKTFSLLPGEKTKISIKSYLKRESDAKSASSILDSFTEESAEDFETSVQNEASNKESYSENFEYHAEAEASASWGWGSAKISGGTKGGTNSAREEFSKNISNATQKHAAKSSAKRDVQINTSYEIKEESGEETSVEREISNINLSRTLNFVFRQMNQEFITLLHLVDVRVAFFNGYAESRREVPLPELDSLLEEVIVPEKRDEVKSAVISQLQGIMDYKDELHSFVEEKLISGSDKYLRVKKDIVSTYKDTVSGTEISVPGIILAATKSVMRTEGIIVEALLGKGEALDDYATKLQEIEVKRREAEAAKEAAEAEKAELINRLAGNNEKEKAQILAELIASSHGIAASRKEGDTP